MGSSQPPTNELHSTRLKGAVGRHAIVSLSFLLLYLVLNRPEVILLARIGSVVWYPAVGLIMPLLLAVSPWYAVLVSICVPLAGKLIYGQPILSFSYSVDALGIGLCYGVAAFILRGPMQIDFRLRRRR